MTATNHALTGAVIALVIKQPILAVPLAFVSHFVTDLVPHYNPPGMTRDKFQNYSESWSEKLAYKPFRFIFGMDMLLFVLVLSSAFFITHSSVSAFSSVAAASPDFVGGFEYLANSLLGYKAKKSGFWAKLADFHVRRLQWMERPWGIYVEIGWFAAMLSLILKIGR